jgi:hypothetical protein
MVLTFDLQLVPSLSLHAHSFFSVRLSVKSSNLLKTIAIVEPHPLGSIQGASGERKVGRYVWCLSQQQQSLNASKRARASCIVHVLTLFLHKGHGLNSKLSGFLTFSKHSLWNWWPHDVFTTSSDNRSKQIGQSLSHGPHSTGIFTIGKDFSFLHWIISSFSPKYFLTNV